MSAPAFTPGPWIYDRDECAIISATAVDDYGRVKVVDLRSAMSGDDTDADAVLLASAPELFEALSAAVANSDANLAAGQPRLGDFKKLYDKAVNALAKARGAQ